ncbi:response regulator transcription factor, partial [Streptomyces sp. WAC05950]
MSPTSPTNSTDGPDGTGSRRRILVVDDEPEVRAAVEDGLTIEGYHVRGATDGLAALSQIAAWEPDAVVLDVMMPVLDGLGVCRQLRTMGDRTPI